MDRFRLFTIGAFLLASTCLNAARDPIVQLIDRCLQTPGAQALDKSEMEVVSVSQLIAPSNKYMQSRELSVQAGVRKIMRGKIAELKDDTIFDRLEFEAFTQHLSDKPFPTGLFSGMHFLLARELEMHLIRKRYVRPSHKRISELDALLVRLDNMAKRLKGIEGDGNVDISPLQEALVQLGNYSNRTVEGVIENPVIGLNGDWGKPIRRLNDLASALEKRLELADRESRIDKLIVDDGENSKTLGAQLRKFAENNFYSEKELRDYMGDIYDLSGDKLSLWSSDAIYQLVTLGVLYNRTPSEIREVYRSLNARDRLEDIEQVLIEMDRLSFGLPLTRN